MAEPVSEDQGEVAYAVYHVASEDESAEPTAAEPSDATPMRKLVMQFPEEWCQLVEAWGRLQPPRPLTRSRGSHRASIPTAFAGVVYRSRLEARVAMLFAMTGIDVIYEMSRISFSAFQAARVAHAVMQDPRRPIEDIQQQMVREDLYLGQTYTPDFYWPVERLWIELKPPGPSLNEMRKLARMVDLGYRAALLEVTTLHTERYGIATSSGEWNPIEVLLKEITVEGQVSSTRRLMVEVSEYGTMGVVAKWQEVVAGGGERPMGDTLANLREGHPALPLQRVWALTEYAFRQWTP